MGKVIIQEFTPKNPITMIGVQAGVCWGADVSDNTRNYQRGIDCLNSGHGRTFEFPDVYMVFEGWSARVVREWYTHIGGLPTRLQESTRYIDYAKGFNYVVPPSIERNEIALDVYNGAMQSVSILLRRLEELGIPREDSALLLPLGMESKFVAKHNLRNLMDMSRQRMCSRAYHEYRRLFGEVCKELSAYSDEWEYLVKNYFMPKCKYTGFCSEKYSCGLMPKKQGV